MAAKLRAAELREALRFFDLVARTPALRARIAALHATGAPLDLGALAMECDCRCSEVALQQAFRIDWLMRQRHFTAPRAPAAPTVANAKRRSGQERRARSRW